VRLVVPRTESPVRGCCAARRASQWFGVRRAFLHFSQGSSMNTAMMLQAILEEELKDAEDRYGPRDTAWRILGIDVGPWGSKTYFPNDDVAVREVLVRLSNTALNSARETRYQLAHEAVHLLAPSRGKGRVIEEGVAVIHSEIAVERKHGTRKYSRRFDVKTKAYDEAAEAVERLLDIDPNAIRKLRHQEPYFDRLTHQHFAIFPGIEAALIDTLLAPFVRDP
jgi:hypothetical protein